MWAPWAFVYKGATCIFLVIVASATVNHALPIGNASAEAAVAAARSLQQTAPSPDPRAVWSRRGHAISLLFPTNILINFTAPAALGRDAHGSFSWWWSYSPGLGNNIPLTYGSAHSPPLEYVPQANSLAALDSLNGTLTTITRLQTTRALLSFHKPDLPATAGGNSIENGTAARAWHRLEALARFHRLALGSPSVGGSTTAWLDDFLKVWMKGGALLGSLPFVAC
jgi:hypothetical protein